MQHTQNYQLSRWAKDDRIMMEDFNADNEKIDAALKAANDRIDTKADAAALSEETSARTAADSSFAGQLAELAANLGVHGRNCRIATGSYVGDGTYGESTPNSLTFDFYPVLVTIGSDITAKSGRNPSVLLRGRSKGSPEGSEKEMLLTWSDSGISWYNSEHEDYQNNHSGRIYYYIVLGYDKAAEET